MRKIAGEARPCDRQRMPNNFPPAVPQCHSEGNPRSDRGIPKLIAVIIALGTPREEDEAVRA